MTTAQRLLNRSNQAVGWASADFKITLAKLCRIYAVAMSSSDRARRYKFNDGSWIVLPFHYGKGKVRDKLWRQVCLGRLTG